MDTEKAFPLSLDFQGQHYTGTITPSKELGKNKMAIYYRVMLGNTFYAYLYCGDYGWKVRDKEGQPPALVQAIGDYIVDYYE
jgi:hypothetical protein